MKKLNNGNIKLAVQKKGRLTEETINLLRGAGLEFESYSQSLFSICRNFPLSILFLRDDDIPDYVEKGAVDLGIVGQNMLFETKSKVDELLKLPYGYCSFSVAVPKESEITDISQLKNKRIATCYERVTGEYFKKKGIPIELISISGSVEVTPALGLADAVADLVSTGSTLALNDLRVIEKIYDSQAMFIATKSLSQEKGALIDKLIMRFQGVISASSYKYVMMNAPETIVEKLKEFVPGLKAPTISRLATKDWISIQTAIKEDVFWDTIEKLKALGATDILVLPVEKLIV